MLLAILFLLRTDATGQERGDSLRSYDLEEIVVTSGQNDAASSSTVQRISLAGIAREEASAIGEVAHLIPAAYVQTNSRGERLVYLRNSGERQVAIFFDGALLNVPWDNRADLSLIPAGVVGGMTVAKGVPSVMYGTNVLGGAVNLTSRTLAESGTHGEVSFSGGLPQAVSTSGNYLFRSGPLAVTASAGYSERTGEALAGGSDLRFSQPDQDLRTNTDRRLSSLFGKASYRTDRGDAFGVSLLHIGGGKGIAPESHINPDDGGVRYWRYPTWRNSMIILTGDAGMWPNARLRGSVWATRVYQRIHQYDSVLFDELNTQQDNTDQVAGGRLVYDQQFSGGSVQVGANLLTSARVQQEVTLDATQERLTYRQHVFSFGSVVNKNVGSATRIDVGASADGVAMPQTGGKPSRDPLLDYSLTGGLVREVGGGLSVRAAVGRKVRFPTMRELFGEALRRFRVNPDLKPETSRTVEAGASYRSRVVTAEMTGFFRRTFDTIDQSILRDGRRMRVNLDGSRVAGLETYATLRPVTRWKMDGHLTWMRMHALEDDRTRPIAERPAVVGVATLEYAAPRGPSIQAQVTHARDVYSMDEDGSLVELPAATLANARAGYRTVLGGTRTVFAEFFVRIDNVADAVVLRQLGLPDPGRELTAGVNLAF